MSLARDGKRFIESLLFGIRRTFTEKHLDPARDTILMSWATYSPWLQDTEFRRCHGIVADHTLVDPYRCWELWHLLGQTRALDGDVIEVGTWRGGTGCLLGSRSQNLGLNAEVFLCDTFTGVVKAGTRDAGYQGGEHADTSVATVEQLASRLALGNIRILQGVFPEETGNLVADRSFRLCHIDVDAYESAGDVLEWVWPRLPVGGIVVFDDFGFASTPGIAELVHELEKRDDLVCMQNLNGHAILVKTAAP